MLELLPLALVSAIYPTLLAIVALIISRSNPRRLLTAYLAGALLTSMAIGLAIVFGAVKILPESDRTVSPIVDFVGAGLALALLLTLATGRGRRVREVRGRRQRRKELHAKPEREPWSQRILKHDSIWLTFVVGMALSLPGVMYLVALKDLAATDPSPVTAVITLLAYNVIMFTWAELPLVGYLVAPDRTEEAVGSIHDWLGSHGREIAMAVCGVGAVYLAIQGIADLN
jgi:MFS family permease